MDVQAILDARQYKTTSVVKDVELQYDLGNLLATDLNPLDAESLRYPSPSLSCWPQTISDYSLPCLWY